MKIENAINRAIKNFGNNVLSDSKLINILNDYNAFEEDKTLKFMFSSFQSLGYLEKIQKVNNWDFESKIIINDIISQTGFEEIKVKNLVNRIAFALGIIEHYQPLSLSPSYNIREAISCITDKDILKIGGPIIERNQFICDDTLKNIILDEGITTIKAGAFKGCRNLRNIVLPYTLKEVENCAFEKCNLEQIEFHGTVPPHIDSNLFGIDKFEKTFGDVKRVIIPYGTEKSYVHAWNAVKMKNLRVNLFPIDGKSFSSDGFEKIKNDNKVSDRVLRLNHTNGIINRNSFAEKGSPMSIFCDVIIIPEGTKKIIDGSFPDIGFPCLSKRIKIIMPFSLEEIGEMAFPYAMMQIEFQSPNPPKVNGACMPWGGNVELIIPKGTLYVYTKASLNWCREARYFLKITEV